MFRQLLNEIGARLVITAGELSTESNAEILASMSIENLRYLTKAFSEGGQGFRDPAVLAMWNEAESRAISPRKRCVDDE